MGGSETIGRDEMLEFAERRPQEVAVMIEQTEAATDGVSEYINVAVELATDGLSPSDLILRHIEIRRLAERNSRVTTELSGTELLKLYYPGSRALDVPDAAESTIVERARDFGPKVAERLDDDAWARFCHAATEVWPTRDRKEAVFDFTTALITLKYMVDCLNESHDDPLAAVRRRQRRFVAFLTDLNEGMLRRVA